MGNITQMSRSTHSPGFGSEDVYAIQLKLWDDDSYGSTVLLTFNDAAHRDACYAAVHSARTKWLEQYGASCTATVDAHSGYWGHSVFPGGYAWNLWVRPESANVDAINESGEVFSDIMHSDKSLHCKQSLRFRAVSPENAQITLRMFRSFTADDDAGLPTQTQQQRQLADLVLAVEAKPESAEAAFNLAVHKLDVENDAKRGEALLRDVLRLNTKHIDARRRIARLRYREGAYADAVRHYSEILDIDASLADVYVARAEACRGAGFTDRVAADYDKAISLDPKFARAYTGRSRLNLDLGQFSQAAEDATRAMQLEPKSAEGVTMRAIVRYVQRDWPGALTDTQAALEIEGRHHDFCQIQAWLLRHRTGDAALAKEKLSAYRQQRSVKSDWFDTLCSFLLRQNMEEDFLKSAKVPEPSFAPRRREANEHGEAWFYVGMLRLFSGKNAEAAEAFDRCCRIGQQTWLECKYADMELEALNRQARAAADAKREADDRARVADERRRAEEQRASLQSTRGMSTSSVGTTSVDTTPVGTRPLAPTPLPVPATIVNRMILPLDISIDGGPKHTIGPFDTYKTALTPGVHRITGSSLSGKLDIRFDLPAKGGAVGIDGSMLHR
jgi:lipoprotein NlpI